MNNLNENISCLLIEDTPKNKRKIHICREPTIGELNKVKRRLDFSDTKSLESSEHLIQCVKISKPRPMNQNSVCSDNYQGVLEEQIWLKKVIRTIITHPDLTGGT